MKPENKNQQVKDLKMPEVKATEIPVAVSNDSPSNLKPKQADSKEAAYLAKRNEVRNKQAGNAPRNNLKDQAKKVAIKKGVSSAAAAAGVPPTVTESVMSSSKADNLIDEAIQSTSTTSGAVDYIVKKLAIRNAYKTIGLAFVPFIFIFMVLFLVIGKYGDSMSYAEGEIAEGFEVLYEAVDKVALEYQNEYGVNVNKNLIISAMTALQSNAEYEDESDEIINIEEEYETEDSIEFYSLPKSKIENWVKLLAKYQIQTNFPTCDDDSSTPRAIASNDKAGGLLIGTAVSREKNYNCFAEEEGHLVSYEQGTLDQNSSGSVFFWNMIDQNFFEEYYGDDFKSLSGEAKEKKKEEYLDYIYIYAKALDEKFGATNLAGGTCEYDHLIVKLYDCDAGNFGRREPDPKYYLESVPFPDYILGVSYAEPGVTPYYIPHRPETLFANVVALRTYVLHRHSNYQPGVTEIRIRNCTHDQLYCDVNKGCHTINSPKSRNTTNISGGYIPGGGGKRALTNAELEEVKEFLEPIRGMVIKKQDGSFVPISYRTSEPKPPSCPLGNCFLFEGDLGALNLEKNHGYNYEDLLRHFFKNSEPFVFEQNCSGQKSSNNFGTKGFQTMVDGSYIIQSYFISNNDYMSPSVDFDGVSINLKNNSSGPAAMTMIVNALSDFDPLNAYFQNQEDPLAVKAETLMVAKMHRYLYKIGEQEELGGSKNNYYSQNAMQRFNINLKATYNKRNINKDTLINHLSEKGLILVKINKEDCPAGTNVCSNLGTTSSSSYLLIYGYNAPNDSFYLHNPSSSNGTSLELESKYLEKISNIAVYEAIEKEDS